MAGTIQNSRRFGASSSFGEFVSEPGKDCALSFASSALSIVRIMATYSVPGVVGGGSVDWENPAATYRSFTGRILVLEGELVDDLSTAPPNIALSDPLPLELRRRVMFDRLMHRIGFEYFWEFDTKERTDPNARGLILTADARISVVLLAGEAFTTAGARAQHFLQTLRVVTTPIPSFTGIEVAPGLSTKN